MVSLVSHAQTAQTGIRDLNVDVRFDSKLWLSLTFGITRADGVYFRNDLPAGRQDDLWKSTCFELFLKPVGRDAYIEFNFAPPLGWQAYHFDKRRKGRRPSLAITQPHMVDSRVDDRRPAFPRRYELDVILALGELPEGPWRVGLSAVIEETDGTKSYWALRHPPGPPDFHHPDCFALTLPAPD